MGFKPIIHVNEKEYRDVVLSKTYTTYRELRKNILEELNKSVDGEVFVTRSRRGYGRFEWFERWVLINGKPKITKQGWQ